MVTEQRTAGDGLVLRGEAELGRGRAPVSGEHLGSGSAGEAAAGEAACPLHPLLCQRDDWGKGQDSAPSRDAPLSRAHCGSPTPCLGFSRSVLCLLLPPAPKMQTGGSAVLALPRALGKPACVQTAGDVLLLFGFSVRRVDAWVLRLSERLHTLQI